MTHHLSKRSQKGFTIIELMIATSVLSVILLLVTSMIIGIGTLFYKGINQSRIQDAVRTTTDQLSKQLQLAGVQPSHGVDSGDPNVNVYCAGDTRYTFILNTPIGGQVDSNIPTSPTGPNYAHVLWRDNITGCDDKTGADLKNANPNHADGATNGSELVTPNSRLTAFCIGTIQTNGTTTTCNYARENLTSPYSVSIGMVYGADDLLNLAGINTTCKGVTGDQFCATASLTTTVVSRLPL